MIIFIDESGDPGLKLNRGSSRYLIISLVIFHDADDANQLTKRIEKFKIKNKSLSNYEFKFNKTRQSIKIKLLKSVRNCNFEIRSVILDKKILDSKSRLKINENLFNYCLKILLKDIISIQKEIKIRLDGSADREFQRSVKSSLRKFLNEKKKKKIKIDFKIVDSKSDVLIQMADMVVGSIRRSYSPKKGDCDIYKNIIKERIINERILQKSDLAPILK